MTLKRFEESLQKLEEIVKQLEGGELTLEASLKLFEEGIRLSRICSKQLEEAERKVEILLHTDGDAPSTKAFIEDEDA